MDNFHWAFTRDSKSFGETEVNLYRPKFVFFTRGLGRAKHQLASFELALRDANIAPFNLVTVSSILPRECKIINRETGVKLLEGKEGSVIYCVKAQSQTDEPRRMISSAIGMAIPKDNNQYGYISECHDYGKCESVIKDEAEDLAAFMLASTLGVPFDIDQAWDQKKEHFHLRKGQIIRTNSIACCASNKVGEWLTVISCAIFI
jgi:arginine decarboxylase